MSTERAWTVKDILKWTVDHFKKVGVPSARLNAELLLADALKLPARLELLLEPDRKLTDAERAAFREHVKRRASREPTAHILGSWGFYGRSFDVTADVLTPRSETELVAERAVSWAKANGAKTALDLGSGSGCLAVTLALEVKELKVVATDISEKALAVARRNAERLKAAERVEFLQGDLFGAVGGCRLEVGGNGGTASAAASASPTTNHQTPTVFDLVVSNPPYIPTAEIEKLMPEVAKWEPRGALDGGADGLDFYRRLAAECASRLRSGGAVVLEIGDGQGRAVSEIFRATGRYADIEVARDLSGLERIFSAVRAQGQ
ncbi:MAG TPA: peptide chain release factor N(5)-glutamine methyltransferase [Planctomycetota bacterium]|nr:peptide chain release factor N(5)-glutamine methyltransferase [Planctomycetota bacterium]